MQKIIAVAAGATILAVGGTTGAMAAADGKIGSFKIRDHSVAQKDIRPAALAKFKKDTVGVVGAEVDGTYKDLLAQEGVQTFTVDCAPGKVALGGGFSVDFPQDRKNVQFVGSTPANFTEIAGDPEGSVVAHGWEVQVINSGPQTSLRPWVVCAAPAN